MNYENSYPISSPTRRILTYLFDYLLVVSICIVVDFLILFLSFDWNKINVGNYDHYLFSGLFTLSMSINLIIWFGYFIIIPGLANGRTLFNLITKTKLHWDSTSNLMSRLLKHEGIAVLPIYFLNIIIGLISFAFESPTLFISSIFTFSKNYSSEWMQIASAILFVVLIIASLFLLGTIINIIANKGKSSYLDDVCEIYFIHLETINKKVIEKTEVNNSLPGSIDERELERL